MTLLELTRQRRRAHLEESAQPNPLPDPGAHSDTTEPTNPQRETVQPPTPAESTPIGLIELLLKNQPRLHKLLRVPTLQAAYLPKLLGISLAGFLLFGVAMSLVLTVARTWPELTAISIWLKSSKHPLLDFEPIESHGSTTTAVLTPWLHGGALRLTTAYAFGLIAATGVCLPSLYFYCLLAGLRLKMVEIVVHAVKAKAVSAIALVGILPIYVAVALGAVIFGAAPEMTSGILILGLLLPLIAGLFGTTSIYKGFASLSDTMTPPCYALGAAGVSLRDARQCFLRRLVLSWSACYLAVMPVMVYAIWQAIS